MSLLDLLRREVMELSGFEESLSEGLAVLRNGCQSGELRTELLRLRDLARCHARHLHTVCDGLGWPVEADAPKMLLGIQWEIREALETVPPGPLSDVVVVATVQKILHLKIAGYGTARALAIRLGEAGIARTVEKCLDEEKRCDDRLTEIAGTRVNPSAAADARGGIRRPAKSGEPETGEFAFQP